MRQGLSLSEIEREREKRTVCLCYIAERYLDRVSISSRAARVCVCREGDARGTFSRLGLISAARAWDPRNEERKSTEAHHP